jgi:hypothetical protein
MGMARIVLSAAQVNPASQQALRALNDLLPERMSIEWKGDQPPCVTYEAGQLSEGEARKIVRSALATLEEQGVRGIVLP